MDQDLYTEFSDDQFFNLVQEYERLYGELKIATDKVMLWGDTKSVWVTRFMRVRTDTSLVQTMIGRIQWDGKNTTYYFHTETAQNI